MKADTHAHEKHTPTSIPHLDSTDQAPPAIDIHRHASKLPRELARLEQDRRVLPANRAILNTYITKASRGRLKQRGRSPPLSPGRCLKLLTVLKRYAMHIGVPFEQVTADELEDFIVGIEDGTIHKLNTVRGTAAYSPETVHDFKKIIRTFYKWLLRDRPEQIEELVGWFETRRLVTRPKALDPRVIPHLGRAVGNTQGEALIWALFDGGFRIGELLNVRLGHDVWINTHGDGQRVVVIDIRVSKTFGRQVALPLASDALIFWIERHPQYAGIDEDGRVRSASSGSLLFSWSYRYCCRVMRELGQRELGEHLHPHRLRHTSASYWGTKLRRHQLCVRMGWSLSSTQPDRYIKRGGFFTERINEEAVSQSEGDRRGEFQRPGVRSIAGEEIARVAQDEVRLHITGGHQNTGWMNNDTQRP